MAQLDEINIIFAILIIVGLIGIVYSAYLIGMYTVSHTLFGGMSEIMRHMMGQESKNYNIPIYIWFLPYVFLLIIAIGTIGVLYNKKFHTEEDYGVKSTQEVVSTEKKNLKTDLDDVLKVLKPDEREVVKLLLENNGRMLQRDITWETGFSRLKTHRVINRLIERGIVKKAPRGNTNLIMLEEWLIKRYRDGLD